MTCVDLTVAAPNALGTATWYYLVADLSSDTENNVPFPLLQSIRRRSRHCSGRGGHDRRRVRQKGASAEQCRKPIFDYVTHSVLTTM